ncbi:MATE family efflux transporter [Fusobacterium sp. IOR10]|uniref:MATE family efflux transporter n=1 Tax=Fusobacterium sp. IOR10 TaxID=2665157 RepID=UPI0013CF9963|nr:MATE family efflux transporter [Fusobacterium sp. IOR10]
MNKKVTDIQLTKKLIYFSLPLILSGLLQQLYNWADAFIVGNVEGEIALAAIGSTGVIINLFVMGITGFTSGISILSARYIREKNQGIQNEILATFLILLGIILILISGVTIYFSENILMALGTPTDIFYIAKRYLQIVLLGIPFITVFNVYAAVLRGIGDSKVSFYAVLVSAVTNIFLDILLVVLFTFGAIGAAIATVISQLMMTIFIIAYAKKKYNIHWEPRKKIFSMNFLKKGSSLTTPITIQSVVTSLGSIVMQNLMNTFGTTTVAAITTAYRIDTLLLLPVVNLATGISIITSQNIGLGRAEDARRSLFIGLKLSLVVSILLTIPVITIGENLIGIFGVGQEAAAIGGRFFYSIGWFYFIYGLAMAMRGYTEGKGDVLYSSISGLLSLVVRIVLSYKLKDSTGNMSLAYGEGLSWVFLFLLFAGRYVYIERYKNRKRV